MDTDSPDWKQLLTATRRELASHLSAAGRARLEALESAVEAEVAHRVKREREACAGAVLNASLPLPMDVWRGTRKGLVAAFARSLAAYLLNRGEAPTRAWALADEAMPAEEATPAPMEESPLVRWARLTLARRDAEAGEAAEGREVVLEVATSEERVRVTVEDLRRFLAPPPEDAAYTRELEAQLAAVRAVLPPAWRTERHPLARVVHALVTRARQWEDLKRLWLKREGEEPWLDMAIRAFAGLPHTLGTHEARLALRGLQAEQSLRLVEKLDTARQEERMACLQALRTHAAKMMNPTLVKQLADEVLAMRLDAEAREYDVTTHTETPT